MDPEYYHNPTALLRVSFEFISRDASGVRKICTPRLVGPLQSSCSYFLH